MQPSESPPRSATSTVLPLVFLVVIVLGGSLGVTAYQLRGLGARLDEENANTVKAVAATVAPTFLPAVKRGQKEEVDTLLKEVRRKFGLSYAEVKGPAVTMSAGQNPGGGIAAEVALEEAGTAYGKLVLVLEPSRAQIPGLLIVGVLGGAALVVAVAVVAFMLPLAGEHAAHAERLAAVTARLQELQEKLPREVQGREQLEAELRRARDLAEAATQAKKAFLNDVGQQLRAPLKNLAQATDHALAAGTELGPKAREHFGPIRTATAALTTLINDLTDFTQMDEGKIELAAVDFQLSDTLDKLLRGPSMRAQAKGLQLDCNIGDTVPEAVHGDPVRLRQVLFNLVDNAIKYTNRGSVKLDVEAQGQTEKEVTLRFAVTDTGIGIPVWKKDTLFDPATLKDGKGKASASGLSLPISARIVEMMGGKMEVDSQVGKGSTFAFTVKLPVAAKDKAKAGAKPLLKPGPREPGAGPKIIHAHGGGKP